MRQSLAGEAVQDGGKLLLRVLPSLFKGGARHVNDFGLAIAQEGQNGQYDQVVLAHCGEELRSFSFLWGYLRGVFLRDQRRWETLVDALLNEPQHSIMFAVIGSGAITKTLQRVLALHGSGEVPDSCLLACGRDAIRDIIGVGGARRVLRSMLARRNPEFYAAAIEIADPNLCKGDAVDPTDE